MDVKQQQGRAYRQRLLFESQPDAVRPETSGTGGTHAGIIEEWQASTASDRKRALSPYRYLMEAICDRENLNRAYKRVKANRGAAGVGRLDEFRTNLPAIRPQIRRLDFE